MAGCVVGISHLGTLQVTPGLMNAEDRKALAALRSGSEEEGRQGSRWHIGSPDRGVDGHSHGSAAR